MSAAPARLRFLAWVIAYGVLAGICLWSLSTGNDLSLGRAPWTNLKNTVADFAHPSFLDIWFGPTRLEYKSDDGTILRVENRREVERRFVAGLADAIWPAVLPQLVSSHLYIWEFNIRDSTFSD